VTLGELTAIFRGQKVPLRRQNELENKGNFLSINHIAWFEENWENWKRIEGEELKEN
jgi:hypothetical protein